MRTREIPPALCRALQAGSDDKPRSQKPALQEQPILRWREMEPVSKTPFSAG